MTQQELIDGIRAAEPGTEMTLYDALVDGLGPDQANQLWDSAIAEIANGDAVQDAVASITELLAAVQTDLGGAARELARLRRGDAWHPGYAETAAGADIEAFLADASRTARAAQTAHQRVVDVARLIPQTSGETPETGR